MVVCSARCTDAKKAAQGASTTISNSVATPLEFFLACSTGPSTVLLLVLGKELLCGLCASPVRSGGVGKAEVSRFEGGLVGWDVSKCELQV